MSEESDDDILLSHPKVDLPYQDDSTDDEISQGDNHIREFSETLFVASSNSDGSKGILAAELFLTQVPTTIESVARHCGSLPPPPPPSKAPSVRKKSIDTPTHQCDSSNSSGLSLLPDRVDLIT